MSIFITGLLMVCLTVSTLGCEEDSQNANLTALAVASDIHYYDPDLGTQSAYLDDIVSKERKMLRESHAILNALIEAIGEDDSIELVLIPGDLTKDGTKQSHIKAAALLAQLEKKGKKVYVVPGNHDINNPHAMSYPQDGEPVLVENISPEEFETIYEDFGFLEALDRDPHSLSYVAEPKEDLWLLGLDSCLYGGGAQVGGALNSNTMRWIETKIQEAKQHNVTIIGMAHHGIIEHFPQMDMVFEEFLIEDWRTVAERFADIGLNIFFTGHNHANDISKLGSNGKHLLDVQTGSLVSWPNTYRKGSINLEDNVIHLSNASLPTIDFEMGGLDFNTYAYNAFTDGFSQTVQDILIDAGVEEETAELLEPTVTPTLLAYYEGDEGSKKDPDLMQQIYSIIALGGEDGELLGNILLGIWEDETPDNTVKIDVEAGTVK